MTIAGCSDSSPASPTPVSAPPPAPAASGNPDDVVGAISQNTGHSARITQAELTEGNALRLDIRGASDHPHIVELSAEDVASIRDGNRVVTISSEVFSHTHEVTFN